MKTCKNDQNKVLARGLCRKCYDALPERVEKRRRYYVENDHAILVAKRYQLKKKLKRITARDYTKTPEYKSYLKAYKNTEEYKRWAYNKKIEYIKIWQQLHPEKHKQWINDNREHWNKIQREYQRELRKNQKTTH